MSQISGRSLVTLKGSVRNTCTLSEETATSSRYSSDCSVLILSTLPEFASELQMPAQTNLSSSLSVNR